MLSNLFKNLFRRATVEREIDDEVRAVYEQLVDEEMRDGKGRDEASRAAGIALGGIEPLKEQVRAVKAGNAIDTLMRDIQYAARLLRRNPLFTATAALSLSIGIGATTTIFTVANSLLFRTPAGVVEPDRLIDIYHTEEGTRLANPMSFYSTYLDVRERSRTLKDVFAYQVDLMPVSLAEADGAVRIFGCLSSPNYFDVLGVRPAAGRMFTAGDGSQPGASPVVVMSHRFWTLHFNRDPAVVGRILRLNSHPFTVVGVASEDFRGTSVLAPDIWIPAPMVETLNRNWSFQGLQIMMGGRLQRGVPISQAAAEIELIAQALHPEGRQKDINGFRVLAGREGLGVAASSPIPGNLRLVVAAFVAVLMTLVGVVLVIACANLAGALLARATTRRREIAVRLALGVGRMRLVRQLITETVLLFVLGGGAGLLLARVMTSVLVSMLPEFPQPIAVTLALDYRVVAFAIALSLVAALLCGLAPALQASREDVVSALKDDARAPVERLRLRNAFVVAQVAFSILLVVAAAVFVERLRSVSAIDRGFDARGIDVASLDLSMAGYTNETGPAFVATLFERMHEMPGVEATLSDRSPSPGRIMGMMGDLTAPGVEPPGGQRGFMGDWYTVAPRYFSTLRIPIVAGRDFTPFDRAGTQPVVIVSQSTARRLWPGQDAIGKTLLWQAGGLMASTNTRATLLVVGVAANLEGRARDVPAALNALTLYVPMEQRYRPQLAILVRPFDGRRTSREIVALVAAVDRNLPILSAGTLQDELSGPEEVQLRIAASVSASVGLIGVLLAGIGIYGVTAYAVASRTREIGIRLALGADRTAVIGMVLRQGMSLVALGAVIGLVLAATFTRLLAGTLFGVTALGAGTLAGAVGLFALIGLVACYAPTRRATGISAMEALRYE